MSSAEETFRQICEKAASLPDVTSGTSCSQTSFKTTKRAFLYIGPGPKGQGYKAMFTLSDSLQQAEKLVEVAPKLYQLGKGGRLSVRFFDDHPFDEEDWRRWLEESYRLAMK